MTTKRVVWLHLTLFLVTVPLVHAQQARNMPRIGYLGASIAASNKEAFRLTLRELGYIEGQNIQFEYRYV